MLELLGKFQLKTRIVFGRGAVEGIGELARDISAKTYLIVADAALDQGGQLALARESLRRAGLAGEVYTEVEPEPYLDNADGAAAVGREARADLVIGMGGGSAMDTAKAAAALMANTGKAQDYVGLNLVPKAGVPTIMVPTTAGTGSEVTFTAVVTNRETKAKGGINSVHLFPDWAVLDPDLTTTVPPDVTAATGMDALTHAIESVSGKASSVFTEAFALTAVKLISANLRRTVYHGNDVQAREKMLYGSLLAGIALADAGVGAAHALAYPLGGMYRIPHGLANAILIPYVMEFNLPAAETAYALTAGAMGASTQSMTPRDAGAMAVEAVRDLCDDIGIPASLSDLDVPVSDIPLLVEGALKVTRPVENNPRTLTSQDAEWIYERAFM
ncbi:MAG: iron-containing alcohol dehydrogenase [Pseudomonadota bacterium]